MLPQNTIHSARTLHDLLNLFLFMRYDLPNFSRQTSRGLRVLSLDLLDIPPIFRTIHQYVRVPSAWIDAPGSRRRILQLFLAIPCANFLGHPSRSSCANFLGHPS